MATCRVCHKPFQQAKREGRCASCLSLTRHKKCQTCATSYVDGSPNNTRRYCDTCSQSAGLPLSTPIEERRRLQIREATRRWTARNPDYILEWNKENPGKVRAYTSKWQKNAWRTDPGYREQHREYERERMKAEQQEAINHYGGRCACCSEDTPVFLSLDHVGGGGNQERKTTGRRTCTTARRSGWPDTLRVLCHNCNWGVHQGQGVCPHQGSDSDAIPKGTPKNAYERERRRGKHREAVLHYGGKCNCCGESRTPFLCLDHILGGGGRDRKESGLRTDDIARRAGWPDTFQVLCWNCNRGRYLNGGVCPHQQKET